MERMNDMDIKQIKEIAETMKKNGLTLLEITQGDVALRMERQPEFHAVSIAPVPAAAESPAEPAPRAAARADSRFIEIKSPMVGMFYAGPSPDSEPFVKVGSRVKKGDTLCVIEAMKLLNEINAERDGEIAEICVEDGQAVEYAQVLFKMVQE